MTRAKDNALALMLSAPSSIMRTPKPLCPRRNFNPKRNPTYCFVRLSDAVFACGPITTLRDVMSAVPVRETPATVP